MESIKEIYETYEKYIFKYLYGLTLDFNLAEELTQETFFQVVKSFHKFRGDCHVSTWIYKIARNVYSQYFRKNNVKTISIDENIFDIPDKNGPEEDFERKENFITFITIGILGYKIGEDAKKDVLTLKTIVKVFENEGLSLEEDKSKYPDEYDLGGIKPSIFTVEDSKDKLLIYIFDSFREKEKILETTDRFKDPFNREEFSYPAKNSLIVFIPDESSKTEEGFKIIGEKLKLISDATFRYLNNGKEIVYKGESESWEGTFTMKYYEHWFKDEESTQYDNYSTNYPVIKYKGKDLDNVGPIDFEYKTTVGEGKSIGNTPDKDGYLRGGSSGGNGAMHDINSDITFIIKWDGKEESIILKAQ